MSSGLFGSTRRELADEAQEMVVLYTKAEKAVLLNQSYTIGGQSLTRADLDKIRAGRKEWENKLASYLSGGERVIRNVVPMDT